jgi:flagellar biosynthetic protein FliR
MTRWVSLLLPVGLIFARTTACVAVLPLFGSRAVPRILGAAVLLAREALCGLALGLAARLVFIAIQQGGVLIGRQMGFALASVLDPTSGERTQPFGMYLDALFTLLFFVAGGHHLLVRLLGRSFEVLPAAGTVDFGALAAGVLAAGSTMLMFTLKLAAPMLAAFLVLAVVLGVLARVLPEMNILLTSLPLRVAVGLILAVAMVPLLATFTDEVAQWLNHFL